MKKLILYFACAAIIMALVPVELTAEQRRRVVVRRPAPRTKVVVRTGHPIRRRLPSTVVVRPARKPVVVTAQPVFLPAVVWTTAVVSLPPPDRLIWEDSETIEREEGWVDANFGIDDNGYALLLGINGRAKLNFAEVTFANGNVQVLDFNEKAQGSGTYRLLNFADGRHVKTVRVLARAESEDAKLTVYLSR